MKLSVSVLLAVVALARASVIAPVSTQYHAQDELGQYSYGYAGGPSSKSETKTADGVVRGGYSYVDGAGVVQSASYVADPHHGFHVAATNLPVAPAAPIPAPVPVAPAVLPAPIVKAVPYTPAVVPAPIAHVAPAPVAHVAPAYPAISAVPAISPYSPIVYAPGYLPGVETPEVTIAKAAHIQAVHDTKALLHSWRRKRSVPHAYGVYPAYGYAPKGFAYSSVTHHYPTPSYHAYPYAHAYPAITPAATVPLAHAPIAHAPIAHAPIAHAPLPLPVGDTPEVVAAKAAHFAAVHEAKARVSHAYPAYPAYPTYAAHHAAPYVPVPVTDTPAVAHAKAAHFAAVHEAKAKAYAHPHW